MAWDKFRAGIKEAMDAYKSVHPENMGEFRYYTYSPDPGRLMDGIAETFRLYSADAKDVVEELNPSDSGNSHGMSGIFGSKFVRALADVGGHFYITADVAVTQGPHGDEIRVTVKDVELDFGDSARTAAEKTSKIVKVKGKDKWYVQSEPGKKFDSYEGAKKRLDQIEMFKHMKKRKSNISIAMRVACGACCPVCGMPMQYDDSSDSYVCRCGYTGQNGPVQVAADIYERFNELNQAIVRAEGDESEELAHLRELDELLRKRSETLDTIKSADVPSKTAGRILKSATQLSPGDLAFDDEDLPVMVLGDDPRGEGFVVFQHLDGELSSMKRTQFKTIDDMRRNFQRVQENKKVYESFSRGPGPSKTSAAASKAKLEQALNRAAASNPRLASIIGTLENSMAPDKIAENLRTIANRIDGSKQPSREMVAQDIRKVIAALEHDASISGMEWFDDVDMLKLSEELVNALKSESAGKLESVIPKMIEQLKNFEFRAKAERQKKQLQPGKPAV